ncbi:MAG: hypothetical protein NTZ56_22965 [Acidobacteria bacterium]|nr:hypothetical protein [Acidobacteriota bacterium]
MPLELELAYFESIKADLVKNHLGKFALVKDQRFVGAFDNPTNAYEKGIKEFGNTIFLVKRIGEQEEAYRNPALALGLMQARL